MSTIIKRAVDALRATNKPYDDQVADELLSFATNLRDTTLKLLENYKKQAATMRQLIFVMQSRCAHYEWYLGSENDPSNPGTWGPEDTIVCYSCGHTVCDERAFAFGKRVKQGDYFIYSKANGRRFTLNAELKKRLGDKLKAKEMTDGIGKERDGDTGAGTGQEPTAGSRGWDEPSASGQSDRSESEGRAVGGDG